MHIKSSFYPTGIGAHPVKGGSTVDRQAQQKSTLKPVQRESNFKQNHETVVAQPPMDRKVVKIDSEQFKAYPVQDRRPLAADPKFDRKTQSALHAYESLQYQNEKDERESISRLLGVDLFV